MQARLLQRLTPLLVLIILFLLFFHFHLDQYLNFNFLHEQRAVLLAWTQAHSLLAILAFIGIYISTIAIAVPSALFLTLTCGFLFGPLGIFYVLISSTIGASILFFAVKIACHDWLDKKTGRWLNQMKQGFQQNAFFYLLSLRLMPIFPFFIVNIVSGLLNVRAKTFISATIIGTLPGTTIYVLIGNGLGQIFDQNQKPSLDILFNPAILLPLMGLALLSFLPIFYQRFTKSQARNDLVNYIEKS
ncbi:TVP38/TMEM64 family inner membrane protein YdjZ [Legionella massiliensis]|uniref:TVP38/TMEM64 family membrane protein n=1 Tax=Legionella massiliensis TaxID=1034943 RepID=A0A078KV16_9GAMM|nr:TVP38/TMEM64 family protein [Legionella massiliensis]CDZ76871.1 TVP38/TMEM64 family inner membrane protein YdjZ [Legionella massiliensis]CEE12609.1 TVP38/TMEM64 family inner membrane protein YdjZ [Legionella massiliensis]